eukprot:8219115-Pyramimonas_sp.AAC.1
MQWHSALSTHRENPFVQQSERERMEAKQHAMRWAARDTTKLLRSESLATLKSVRPVLSILPSTHTCRSS